MTNNHRHPVSSETNRFTPLPGFPAAPQHLPCTPLRLEPRDVRAFSHESNGTEMAVQAIEAIFYMLHGEEKKQSERNQGPLRDELTFAKAQVSLNVDQLESSKQFFESKNGGVSTMDPITKGTQWGLGLGCLGLLGLGVNALATNLMRYGEPFLSRPSLAYLVALSGPPALAILIKGIISQPLTEKARNAIAGVVAVIGVIAAVWFVLMLSQIVRPEFGPAPKVEELIPRLDATPAQEVGAAAISTPEAGPHFLFAQILAEACGAAVLGHFFVRNQARFRTHVFLKSTESKTTRAEISSWQTRVRNLEEEIGRSEGRIDELDHLLVLSRITAIGEVRLAQRRNDLFRDDNG